MEASPDEIAAPAAAAPVPAPDDNSDDELEAKSEILAMPQPVYEGVILKQAVSSRWFKPWTRRKVTVSPGKIAWSKCAGHSRSMTLLGSTCRAVLGQPLRISITFDGGAQLVMQADDEASARVWASAVATAAEVPRPPQQLLPELGDVAHDAEARKLATLSANDKGTFYSALFLRNPPGYFTCTCRATQPLKTRGTRSSAPA